MNNIERLTNIDTTEEQSDLLLKALITKKLDNDFRKSFELKLKKQSSRRTTKTIPFPNKKKNWLMTIGSFAAAMFILVFINIGIGNNESADVLAMNLLDKSIVSHPGASRSISKISQARGAAVLYFNKGNFDEALRNFELIEDFSHEDIFYMGLSFMKIGEYEKAISQLSKSFNNSLYKQESQYFLILLNIATEHDANAIQLIDQMQKGDYKYDECMQVRQKLSTSGIHN